MVRGPARGPLARGLTVADQLLELGGLSADAVDELLAERGRRDRTGGFGMGRDLAGHARDVGGHVGACGVGERGRAGQERPLVAGGPLESPRGLRESRLGRDRRSQEQLLAGDHVTTQARLRVDDRALDIDRGG